MARAALDAAGAGPPARTREPPTGLTQREVEVLRLVVTGLSNRPMAEVLYVSPKTVGNHI